MKEFNEEEALLNFKKEPLHVKHSELKISGDSFFRSFCPECNDGLLLVKRDLETFTLSAEDNCTLCARRFIYDDIDYLNNPEGESNANSKS